MRHGAAPWMLLTLVAAGCTPPASALPHPSSPVHACEALVAELIPGIVRHVVPPAMPGSTQQVHADVQTFANAGGAFCGEPITRSRLNEAFGASVRDARLADSDFGNGGLHVMLESITRREEDLDVIVWLSSRRPWATAPGASDATSYLLTFRRCGSGEWEVVQKRGVFTT